MYICDVLFCCVFFPQSLLFKAAWPQRCAGLDRCASGGENGRRGTMELDERTGLIKKNKVL